MTPIEQWYIRRIIKREVRQDYDHPQKITNLYRMIREAAENEFTEDNIPTLNSALTDWFNDSLRKIE